MIYFGDLLDAALGQNLEQQFQMQHIRNEYSDKTWLVEYCVVQLSTGRRTGKTHAISQRATSKDLVLVHSQAAVKDFKEKSVYQPLVDRIHSLDTPDKYRGLRLDRIWVDNANWTLHDINLGKLFDVALATRVNQLILIG